MILRYTIEGKFAATFTSMKIVKDKDDAYRIVVALGLLNQRAGYMKYSNPILYDDNNNIIERINLPQ